MDPQLHRHEGMCYLRRTPSYSATGLPTLGKPKVILDAVSSSAKTDITTIHLIGLF